MKKENKFGIVIVTLFTLIWICFSIWGFAQMKKNNELPVASIEKIEK